MALMLDGGVGSLAFAHVRSRYWKKVRNAELRLGKTWDFNEWFAENPEDVDRWDVG